MATKSHSAKAKILKQVAMTQKRLKIGIVKSNAVYWKIDCGIQKCSNT